MFVILCYDIGIKRNAKVKKIVRKFLLPVQKSVCEGYITDGKLKKLCAMLKDKVDPDEDSVIVYKFDANPDFERMVIGQAEPDGDFIL